MCRWSSSCSCFDCSTGTKPKMLSKGYKTELRKHPPNVMGGGISPRERMCYEGYRGLPLTCDWDWVSVVAKCQICLYVHKVRDLASSVRLFVRCFHCEGIAQGSVTQTCGIPLPLHRSHSIPFLTAVHSMVFSYSCLQPRRYPGVLSLSLNLNFINKNKVQQQAEAH
jgi:hypothetical protein